MRTPRSSRECIRAGPRFVGSHWYLPSLLSINTDVGQDIQNLSVNSRSLEALTGTDRHFEDQKERDKAKEIFRALILSVL